MKKQLKNITIYILFFLSLFSGAMNVAHAEDGRLQITVDEGLKGKAKRDEGFPVTLTVKNNGEDFSGDLIITIPRDYNSIGNKVIPIDIASEATKEIHFSVSGMEGMSLLQNRPGQQTVEQFHLYEGSWEDGKEVPVDTGLAITPTYINKDKNVIGVLTDQPDELNYLKLLTFGGESPEVLFLDQEDIPEQSIGLGALDILVVQDYTIANLSKESQKAIGGWLKKGGHLVAGSSLGMKQQFDTLFDYLPYSIEGQQTVDSLEALNQMGSLNVSDFELFQGNVKEGATASYEEQGTPLVIGQQIGQGEVTQFSYDMSHPVFQEWDGNQDLWDSFVDPYYPGSNRNINDQLGRASQSFETVANFKLSTLAFLFVGYLLLVVPVLYFILKKLDKREWAWLVIPALAVMSSLGLYFVGAQDRLGDYKTKAVSVLSVDQNGQGYGKGALSMLSKSAGMYSMELDASLEPFPDETRRGARIRPEQMPYVESGQEQSRVTFKDVEFWSPRTVTVNLPDQNYGHIQNNLFMEDNHLTGEIKNKFSYDFEDVYLIGGQSYQKLGALKAGDSKEIDIQMQQTILLQSPNERTAFQMFGQPTGNSGLSNNERNLRRDLIQVVARNGMFEGHNGPVLIGFTENQIYETSVNGKETAQDNLHLVTQPVNLGLSAGEGETLSVELNNPGLSVIEGNVHHNGLPNGELMFDSTKGTYMLNYELPANFEKQSLRVDSLNLNIRKPTQGVTFAIYNKRVDAYDTIEGDSYDQDVQETYVENGVIKVRVTVTDSKQNGPIFVPRVAVEGVTKP